MLRPGGQLRYYEHVIGTSKRLATVQRAMAPGLAKVFGGCRADRDTGAAIETAGFRIERQRRFLRRTLFDAPAAPRILGAARRARRRRGLRVLRVFWRYALIRAEPRTAA